MIDQNEAFEVANGYGPGHPWYYVRGGEPLTPRQILRSVEDSRYKGCLAADIAKLDSLSEPKRSELLRALQVRVRSECRANFCAYRRFVRKLRAHRLQQPAECACANVHVAISLKHNHLYNDFAHLLELHRLLTFQRDLFG